MACGRLLKYWPEAENLAVAVAATVAVEARYEEDGAARDRKDDDEVFSPRLPTFLFLAAHFTACYLAAWLLWRPPCVHS